MSDERSRGALDGRERALRAAVLRAPRSVCIEQWPTPVPGPGEVAITVEAVGLCGTDLHIFSGEANYHLDALGRPIPLEQTPQILGHEIAGFIQALGPGVNGLAVGLPVVVDQGRNCSSRERPELCEYCRTGDSHQCVDYEEHGITGLAGGLAERLVVSAKSVLGRLPETPALRAALVEPLACVLHALDLMRRGSPRYPLEGPRAARSLVLCGGGTAGLLFVQVLRNVLGYDGTLLVSEPDEIKRALAARFGATPLDPAREDLRQAVERLTDGRRAEIVIEASGNGPLFRLLPGLLRKQATLLLYGHGHGGIGMEALNEVQWREPHLVSPIGASGGFDVDGRPSVYREALQLVESGAVAVDPLITREVDGLEGVAAAFATWGGPGSVKTVVRLDRSRERSGEFPAEPRNVG